MLFDTDVLLRMLHISTKAAKEEDAGRNRRAGALKRAINALPSTFFSLLPTFVYFVVPIHPCRRLRHIKGTTPVSPQFLPPSICNTRTPPGMTHPAARRRSIEGANQRPPIGLFLSIVHFSIRENKPRRRFPTLIGNRAYIIIASETSNHLVFL